MNVVAYIHSYKLTHFANEEAKKISAYNLPLSEKFKVLLCGIDNPRPVNRDKPSVPYKTFKLRSNKIIECWLIDTNQPRGTIILFHGFGACKSQMLDKAEIFLKLNYSVLLVDFMGVGHSEGNQTTIGYLEAEQVKTCYDYLNRQGEKRIYLFGTSMGAVAVMKAVKDYDLKPAGLILECPFGTMYKTVCARFKMAKMPEIPMAGLLVFWGGIQNGFWAFRHNPVAYATKISSPVLLMYGEQDDRVSKAEIIEIFKNLKSTEKSLRTYPLAGHENYLIRHKDQWTQDVSNFLLGT